jgi:hypothetical protein
MDPLIARKTWRTLEPLHGAIYFVPEAVDAYRALGAPHPGSAYFASRAAPMGAVATNVVAATFFNFEPGYVRESLDGAWDVAAPADWTAARLRAADAMFDRLVVDRPDPGVLERIADLTRTAALAACERPEGRPLFAGYAELPWPSEPQLVVFHAQTLLREFRGDGHIAALVAEGLSGIEALVTHAASGDVTAEVLRTTRRWSVADWTAAEDRLRSGGWLAADGSFTDEGRRRRQWIEDRTDELAAGPYAAIGEDCCDELRALARPLSRQMAAAFG